MAQIRSKGGKSGGKGGNKLAQIRGDGGKKQGGGSKMAQIRGDGGKKQGGGSKVAQAQTGKTPRE